MSRWSQPEYPGVCLSRYFLLAGCVDTLQSTIVSQSIHRLKGQWACVFLLVYIIAFYISWGFHSRGLIEA